ncbi:hypothetical protein HG536_0B01320 [Torulaspora globosa]|uniref:Uncharacterized protein n=1 Tax=Torulaspora globosa TaxID=48254 RepID=A0A7G3ZCN4_9SACH|nr:uncharacterized protein HG536_0B01320 [Torulaspora globosa]QLL31270.1 hypothetical protein HG536_0B01320 [Torulaspora globosa]
MKHEDASSEQLSYYSLSDSEIDSDLRRDRADQPVRMTETKFRSSSDGVSENSSPDFFIGGAKVRTNSKSHESLYRGKSIYDDEPEEEDSDILQSTSTTSPIGQLYGTNSGKNQPDFDKTEQDIQQKRATHKIFTFALPFGGKSILPSSPISSIVSSMMSNESVDKNGATDKYKIKEKLKRSESITTLEELALFKNTKGIDNVRARALKKTFELESLKQTLKNITSSTGDLTSDGYQITRLDTIWNELEGNFLVMGGYRGSILRDAKTNRRVWIPIRAGLNIRKVDLLIGPTDEDEAQAQRIIKPDGMLTHIGPVDVSKRLIKKLKSNPNVEVENYGYDWRLSLDISAEQLRQKLQDIYDSQTVKKGTFIIAHSMGGMVAHKVLQDHTHLIRGIIYVGAPSECPNILGPLKFGDEVIMNKTILSKEANFFMRSSFYFLPTNGTCFVNKTTYKKYHIDFFDPTVWVKLGLSPVVDEDRKKLEMKLTRKEEGDERATIIEYKNQKQNMAKTESKEKQPQPGISAEVKDLLGLINPVPILRSLSGPSAFTSHTIKPLKVLNPAPLLSKFSSATTDVIGLKDGKECDQEDGALTFLTPYEECLQYLIRTLRRAKNYLNSLGHIKDKTYPPLVIVYSKSVPTVRGVKIDGLDDIKRGNYNNFYYGPGDGVVHHKWLLPEQRGFPLAAKIESTCGHVSLLSDLDSMAKALISLVDEEKKADTEESCK